MRTATYLKKIPSLRGKTYVITGANSGLGFALSAILLEKEAHVIMANRSPMKSKEAIEKLKTKYKDAKISEYHYDQSKKESIASFVGALEKDNVHLDGVIFNAGIYIPSKGAKTNNDLALTFAVNFFGNYLLTKYLAESSLLNEDTRLIYTTSPAAYKKFSARLLEKTIAGDKMTRHHQYKASKVCLNIFSAGLMKKSEVVPFTIKGKVYLYHPGVSNSNITRFKFKPLNAAAHIFMRVVFHTPRKAVLGAVRALALQNEPRFEMLVPRGPFETSGIPKAKKIDESLLTHLPLLINRVKDI